MSAHLRLVPALRTRKRRRWAWSASIVVRAPWRCFRAANDNAGAARVDVCMLAWMTARWGKVKAAR